MGSIGLNEEKVELLNKKYIVKNFSNKDRARLATISEKQEQSYAHSRKKQQGEFNKEVEATTFTLSNGIKVHYKFANKNENDVRLSATSYGGMSLLDNSLLASASLTTGVAQFSGLGDFSRTDLPKVLAGKTASATAFISFLS